MGEVINLRRARKEREKAAKEAEAAANRLLHGRSKAERRLAEGEAEIAARRLEGHRRDEPDEPA